MAGTVADKLAAIYDTKVNLKAAIERKGGIVPENMPFADYPSAVNGLNTITPQAPSYYWAKNEQWWDIKAILEADSNATYQYAYIVLLSDLELSTALTGGSAYKTSDGAYYTSNSVTHVWDTTKDRDSGEGYSTRYVIVYLSAPYTFKCVCFPGTIGVVIKADLYSPFAYNGSTTTSDMFMFQPSTCLGKINFIEMLDGYNLYLSLPGTGGRNYFLGSSVFLRLLNLKRFPAIKAGNYSHVQYGYEGHECTWYYPCDVFNYELPSKGVNECNSAIPTSSSYFTNGLGWTLKIPPIVHTFNLTRKTVFTVVGSGTYPKYAMLQVIGRIGSTNGYFYDSYESQLTNVTIEAGIPWYSIDIRDTRCITLASVRNIINAIQDNTGGTTKYFYINSYTNDKMTTADKLLIASKNWTLSVVAMTN